MVATNVAPQHEIAPGFEPCARESEYYLEVVAAPHEYQTDGDEFLETDDEVAATHAHGVFEPEDEEHSETDDEGSETLSEQMFWSMNE